MYRLETNASFDSAHFLKGYQGKCSNIHGHRWKVEVAVAGERLSEEEQTRGMLVDFGNLKAYYYLTNAKRNSSIHAIRDFTNCLVEMKDTGA